MSVSSATDASPVGTTMIPVPPRYDSPRPKPAAPAEAPKVDTSSMTMEELFEWNAKRVKQTEDMLQTMLAQEAAKQDLEKMWEKEKNQREYEDHLMDWNPLYMLYQKLKPEGKK